MIRARFRPRGRLLGAAIVVSVVGAGTAYATTSSTAAEPQLRFVGTVTAVNVDRYPGEPIGLDLGTHVVAGKTPFEIRAKRKSYRDPIVATQVIRNGNRVTEKALPAGLLTDWGGLPGFTHVTVTDPTGKVVAEKDETFCPNSFDTKRTRPDAPDRTPYPFYCPFNAFTLGSVMGIQAGWSAQVSPGWRDRQPIELADGSYTARVQVAKKYRDLFGIQAEPVTVGLTVKTVDIPPDGGPGGPRGKAKTPDNQPKPNAKRPTGKAVVPKGPKPDLRSLPAWDIQIGTELPPDVPQPEGDFLSFSANVWVAGNSPLVVDGFRRSGQEIMDAFQYFYDDRGRQVGFAPVGTMEYDSRDGHNHWHFTDFAQYRLLDADKKTAVKSGKEAFCLASTDAIDYTLPHANWRPDSTDLHTACGDRTSLAVREVLDVGNGDTYVQSLPGQNFDITDVPNGTYYVEVSANPDHKLIETNTKNNVSLRKVILGGVKGARTVTVPPYQGIEA